MAIYNGRDKYEDYTYDDEMNDEFYDEYDDDEESLAKTITDWFKRTKSTVFKKHDDDDVYDDEDYDDEDYREEKKISFKTLFARELDDEDFDDEEEPSPRKVKKSTTSEYTREDYDSYDKKYGTRGSYVRAEQSEKNKAKIFTGKKPKSRAASTANNVTKLYEEERYKGNVKGVLKFSPKGIDDTNDIADNLMNQYAALIDLRGMGKTEILRVLDFIDGVAYVLDYSFDEISKEIYMCAPKGYLKSFSGSRYKSANND